MKTNDANKKQMPLFGLVAFVATIRNLRRALELYIDRLSTV